MAIINKIRRNFFNFLFLVLLVNIIFLLNYMSFHASQSFYLKAPAMKNWKEWGISQWLGSEPNECKAIEMDILWSMYNLSNHTYYSRLKSMLRNPYDLPCVNNLKVPNWEFNYWKAYKFRKCLDESLNTRDSLVMNLNNVRRGKHIPYVQSAFGRRNYTFSNRILRSLTPLKSPFINTLYQSCSVVGSSGILSNSSCGEEIDKNAFIFRFNGPYILPHAKDAGLKTNFTTLNPVGVIANRYHDLINFTDQSDFMKAITQYKGFLFLPIYTSRSANIHGQKALNYLQNAKIHNNFTNISVLVGSPEHFLAAQRFWRKWGSFQRNERMSTGLYFVTVAMSLCKETHLFGFWPFKHDLDGARTHYHYYDDLKPPASNISLSHNFLREFCILSQLHSEGILKIHHDKCFAN